LYAALIWVKNNRFIPIVKKKMVLWKSFLEWLGGIKFIFIYLWLGILVCWLLTWGWLQTKVIYNQNTKI
jgi:hypothetical protein